MKKIKNSIKVLPFEMYYEILSFFYKPKDFFNFLLVDKEIYNWSYSGNCYAKTKGVRFVLLKPEYAKKTSYPFVINLYIRDVEEDGIISFLGKCKNLEIVDIYVNLHVTNKTFSHLGNIKELMLNGENERITNKCLSYLINIKYLNMEYCCQKTITDEGFKNLNLLKRLSIWGCDQLTGEMFKYLPNLTELWMGQCYNIRNDTFKYLSKIKEIAISYCQQLNDEIFHHLKNLEYLKMEKCQGINGKGFRHLKKLIVLVMDGSKRIMNDNLKYLHNIRVLSIGGCTQITDKGIENLKNIKFLNIDGCTQITDKGIENLKKTLIKISIENIPTIDKTKFCNLTKNMWWKYTLL